MNLMIIESPGKLKKLREIMTKIRPDEDWQIEPSVGHVRDLPASGDKEDEITTGVKKNFMPVYELTERGAAVVAKLRKAAAQATSVYLATDPDREGESIAWHLKEAIGLKSHIRISFNEITETRVKEALANQGLIDMKMVGAQECRRVLDRLVGYLVSTELRRQTGENISAGRVQSVAVLLVVLRERAIQAFRVTLHYGAELIFSGAKPDEQWRAEWMTAEGFVTDDDPYFMDSRFAELVAAVRDTVVLSVDEEDKNRNPPAPFTTSTLQQAGSNSLGWSTTKTMKVAQELYEQGLISYHRSDNPNVSDESMPAIKAVAQSLGLGVVDKRRTFKAKDGAQEGHPGITPTYWDKPEAGETSDQQTLYKLIRIRAIASQLLPARYKVRTAILRAAQPIEGKTIKFGAAGRTLVDPGWLKLLSGDVTDDDEKEEAANPIPKLEPGQAVRAVDGVLLSKKTKAPKRYTEASLVKALESEGIGRPATYAAIMNNIQVRELIGESKRFLMPLPKGEKAIEVMENKFSFLDVNFTRAMEDDLDAISQGKAQYRAVIQNLYGTLAGELESQQSGVPTFVKVEPVYNCPECQKPLRRIAKSANGAFWSCTGYPDTCQVSLPDANGKPGKKKEVKLSEFPCGKCERPLIRRQKAGKNGYDFWGCSGFSQGCKTNYPNIKGKNRPDMEKGK